MICNTHIHDQWSAMAFSRFTQRSAFLRRQAASLPGPCDGLLEYEASGSHLSRRRRDMDDDLRRCSTGWTMDGSAPAASGVHAAARRRRDGRRHRGGDGRRGGHADSVKVLFVREHARHRRPEAPGRLRGTAQPRSTWPSARSAGSRAACGSRARSTPAAPTPRSRPASCACACRASTNGAAARFAFPCGPTDVRILFIGDIFGKPGREIAQRAPCPRSSSSATSTSSSPTSRTPPRASASPATSPTRSSATAST